MGKIIVLCRGGFLRGVHPCSSGYYTCRHAAVYTCTCSRAQTCTHGIWRPDLRSGARPRAALLAPAEVAAERLVPEPLPRRTRGRPGHAVRTTWHCVPGAVQQQLCYRDSCSTHSLVLLVLRLYNIHINTVHNTTIRVYVKISYTQNILYTCIYIANIHMQMHIQIHIHIHIHIHMQITCYTYIPYHIYIQIKHREGEMHVHN